MTHTTYLCLVDKIFSLLFFDLMCLILTHDTLRIRWGEVVPLSLLSLFIMKQYDISNDIQIHNITIYIQFRWRYLLTWSHSKAYQQQCINVRYPNPMRCNKHNPNLTTSVYTIYIYNFHSHEWSSRLLSLSLERGRESCSHTKWLEKPNVHPHEPGTLQLHYKMTGAHASGYKKVHLMVWNTRM